MYVKHFLASILVATSLIKSQSWLVQIQRFVCSETIKIVLWKRAVNITLWLCGTYGVHYTPSQHPAERENTKSALLLAKPEITETCLLKMIDLRKNMPVTSKEYQNKDILELSENEKPPNEDKRRIEGRNKCKATLNSPMTESFRSDLESNTLKQT